MKTTKLMVGTCISVLLSGCGAGALQTSVNVVGVIQGTVVDASSQLPIPSATIGINVDGNLLQTVTNADGAFSFADVPVNSQSTDSQGYRVTVSNVTGYATSFSDVLLQRGDGDVPATNTHANTLISIHKASAKIMGTIINPVDGHPIADAEITLEVNPGIRATNATPAPWELKATNATFVPPTTRVKTNENGIFQFVDVPELAKYDMHIYKDGFAIANFSNIDVPAGAVVDLANKAPDSGGTLLLGQGIALNPSTTSSAADRQGPYFVSASISPYQDVALGNSNKNITITFNEPILEATASSLILLKVGYKGELPTLRTNIPANITTPYYEYNPPRPTQVGYGVLGGKTAATHLSDDKRTVVIDIDPARPLDPGVFFAVVGFEGIQDVQRNFFDGSSHYNALPRTGTQAYLPFSTNAESSLLALTGAPRQIERSAQNLGAGSYNGSTSLDLDLKGLVPENARGFSVYATPHSDHFVPDAACPVGQTALSNAPATAISIPLSTIRENLLNCGTTLANTAWDNGLSLDIAVAVINRDGLEGPLSSVLVAKDNRKPEIATVYAYADWRMGSTNGTFLIELRMSEPIPTTLLRNRDNYVAASADGDTYQVTSVEVSDDDPSRAVVHLAFESKAGPINEVAATDSNDTPATATPITALPARLSGYICCSYGGIDYYSFDGQENTRIEIVNDYCCGSDASIGLFLGDVSPANLVATFTGGSGSKVLTASGRYYLKVLTSSYSSYRLLVTAGANGRVSLGDRLALRDSVLDKAGNTFNLEKNSIVVTPTGLAIGDPN